MKFHPEEIFREITRVTDPVLAVGCFPALHLNLSRDNDTRDERDVQRERERDVKSVSSYSVLEEELRLRGV